MAETAKFRKEEMPTGWDAATQSFRQSPLMVPIRAAANTLTNLASIPGAVARSGFRAGQNFDMSQGAGGGIMPPAAMAEAARVRQDLNPNGAGILTNALPAMTAAAIAAPQNFTAAATDQPTYPEARGFRANYVPDMSLTPRTEIADFVPAPTVGNVEDPRAENYGRGITEVFNAPGQQGRSFTNLIAPGAPATGINEMTQRFRGDTQGAVSDTGAVLTNASGRGSFRTENLVPAAPTPAATPAVATPATTFEGAFRTAMDASKIDRPFWQKETAKQRAERVQAATDYAAKAVDLSQTEGLRDAQAGKFRFDAGAGGTSEVELRNAQAGKFRAEAAAEPVKAAAAQTKAIADAKEATSKFGVNLEASFEETPLDPANPLLGTTKTISGFTSKGGANPVFIPLAAMQAYRAARAAATTPEEIQAVEAKFRAYYQL